MCNYIEEYSQESVPVILPFDVQVLDWQSTLDRVVTNMLGSDTLDSGSRTIMGSVCRLLISRELIERNGLAFIPDVPLMEDLIFCIQALLKCSSVA